ncbi:unnamed protein product [Closterium sp. Naga37s-1]|nr:unnamed protein product [Closterium sp. Naga37s-1]
MLHDSDLARGMDLTTDELRSLVRKWQTLIECHVDVKTTDNDTLRLFAIAFTKRRQNQINKSPPTPQHPPAPDGVEGYWGVGAERSAAALSVRGCPFLTVSALPPSPDPPLDVAVTHSA